MAYSIDFRTSVVNKLKQGMKWDDVVKLFQVSRATLSKWLKMAETGKLSDSPRKEYKTRKINKHELIKLVEKQPDWTLSQYAEQFNCGSQAIASCFKKLGITRKKKLSYTKKGMRKRDKPINVSLKR